MTAQFWHRCDHCGYMYTPQQVQALVQLQVSRTGGGDVAEAAPSEIRCRKKGCDGTVRQSDSVFRERDGR